MLHVEHLRLSFSSLFLSISRTSTKCAEWKRNLTLDFYFVLRYKWFALCASGTAYPEVIVLEVKHPTVPSHLMTAVKRSVICSTDCRIVKTQMVR